MLPRNITCQQLQILVGAAAEHDGFEVGQLLLGQLVEGAHEEYLFLQDLRLRVNKRDHVERLHIHQQGLSTLGFLEHILYVILGNGDQICLFTIAV